jgi:hypothetical protein
MREAVALPARERRQSAVGLSAAILSVLSKEAGMNAAPPPPNSLDVTNR